MRNVSKLVVGSGEQNKNFIDTFSTICRQKTGADLSADIGPGCFGNYESWIYKFLKKYTCFFYEKTKQNIIFINIFSRYVDKNRLAAVSTGADLKADISHGRFGRRMEGEFQLGDPDDKFYIMQAEHMIKSCNTDMALHFVKQALDFKADNQVKYK